MRKVEFVTQIAGILGAFAMTNQYSVKTLKDQLKRKNLLIKTLEAKLSTVVAIAKDQTSATLEEERIKYQKEIEQLKFDLE